MKFKFIKVWDDLKYGYVKFIILQVEESDKFLTESYFNPGYKFIIQAIYNKVGAVGGHEFNPYYGSKVRDISQKIDTTEADVLGFYLQNVNDVNEIPDELYTENIWKVLYTAADSDKEEEYFSEDCFKVLLINKYENLREIHDNLLAAISAIEKPGRTIDTDYSDIKKMIEHNNKIFSDKLDEPSRDIYFLIIDKKTLKVIDYYRNYTEPNEAIAKYLWNVSEELPDRLLDEVIQVNENYYNLRLFNFNKD